VINEIVMALMFSALFILVVSAVIVGGRMGKAKTRPAPEIDEEPPKEPPKKREPLPEESPSTEVEQHPESMEFFEEEPRLYMPEPEEVEETVEFYEPAVELPEPEAAEESVEFFEPAVELPEPEAAEESVEFFEPAVELPEPEEVEETVEFYEPAVELPETEYVPITEEPEREASMPEVVSPEPVLFEEPQAEEPVDAQPFEDTYREPAYFRDEDVIPIQGVTTCPHCGEKVPATLYCINCGKSLNE
jgi:hypothetical protein